MSELESREYRLKVGKVTIGLICFSPVYAQNLQKYFQTTSSLEKTDLRLDLEFTEDFIVPDLPNNLFTSKKLTKNGFSIAEDLISGHYDPQTKYGRIKVKGLITRGHFTRIFEQFLYQAFYSARKALNYDAFLIHSSGVIRTSKDGQKEGFLFVGASEAGKSTVASLSLDHTITNDEMNLIEFTDDGPILHATPFNGLFHEKETETRAPLRAIMLLDKGPEHQLQEISQRAAVTLLASQIAPPVGIEDEMDQITGMDLLELADRLSTSAPVRKMTFLRDAGFWTEINDTFPMEITSRSRS